MRRGSGRGNDPGLVAITLIAIGVTVTGTFAEFAIGPLGGAFNAELGVPLSSMGSLTAIMFVAGGVASMPAGWLVDRVRPATLLLAQTALAMLSFAAFALVTNETGLRWACIGVGIAMATGVPLSNKIIATHLSPQRFALAVAWRSVGPQIAAVLAGTGFGIGTEWVGWRNTVWFWVTFLSAAAVVSWLVLRRTRPYTRPPREPGTADPTGRPPTRHNPIVWWLLPTTFFTIGAIGSVGAYLPIYAIEELGLDPAAASASVAVTAIVSVVARLIWLRALSSTSGVRVIVIAGLTTALSTLLLILSPQIGPWFFWVAVVLLGATALGSTPIGQVLLIQNANLMKIGSISAWMGIVTFAGLAFQPWALSKLIEPIGFRSAWAVMAAGGIMSAITICTFSLWSRRRWRDRS